MKTKIDFEGYDTLLQPTDWRYAAAAVGLCKYLDRFRIDYKILDDIAEKPENYIQGFDGVVYRQEDITEQRYLEFAEEYFKAYMTHITILHILDKDDFDDEAIKAVNDLVKSKTVLKKLFSAVKFDGKNKEIFISTINENRAEIVKSIFRYGNNLYKNYCNENLMFTDENSTCRLAGYSVDKGRKTNILGFCFSKDSFECNDILEFDFIPFAFSNANMSETFFVNNNFSVRKLTQVNEALSEQLKGTDAFDPRTKLLLVLQGAKDFINYDVEIIVKSQDNSYYSTLFVRLERLEMLRQLSEKSLQFIRKIADGYWFNLEREVYLRCLNNVLLDDLILQMLKYSLKDNDNVGYIKNKTDILIDINQSWKGNKVMNEIESAKKCGFYASKKLVEMNSKNKINSYKQKISSALCAHDYDRVKEVILSLSAYVDMEFAFFYKFLDNSEENKDIAFAFASALIEPKNNSEKNN